MHKRGILKVTSTYPVFVKASTENESGLNFSINLSNVKKKDYKKTIEYMDRFNLELNKYVEECYDRAEDYYLGKQNDSNVIFILFKGEYEISLYTLKTNNHLILLNFGNFKFNDIINEIPDIKDYDLHVKEFSRGNKLFRVTSTYDSFQKFSDINDIYPNKELNKTFFDSFIKSIENIDLSLNKAERKVRDQDFFKVNEENTYFNYIVVGDLIIITDYFKTSLYLKKN